MPTSPTVAGDVLALLVIATLPIALPVAAGANVTLRMALCPGAKMVPLGTPVALNPGPDTLVFEIVMVDWPESVNFKVKVPLLPRYTFPKFRLDVLMLRPLPLRASAWAVPTAVVMPTHPELKTVNKSSNDKQRRHFLVIT